MEVITLKWIYDSFIRTSYLKVANSEYIIYSLLADLDSWLMKQAYAYLYNRRNPHL